MNDAYGFSNYEWKIFSTHAIVATNFTDQKKFREVIRLMSLRWKRHAVASLKEGPARMVALPDGLNDPIDDVYLQSVESEFPLDPYFRTEFRRAMTNKLNTSISAEAKLSDIRTKVLWDSCTRLLVKLMPEAMRLKVMMPLMPLYGLCDPSNLLRSRNNVIIEDIDESPTTATKKADISAADQLRLLPRQEQMSFVVFGNYTLLAREYGEQV